MRGSSQYTDCYGSSELGLHNPQNFAQRVCAFQLKSFTHGRRATPKQLAHDSPLLNTWSCVPSRDSVGGKCFNSPFRFSRSQESTMCDDRLFVRKKRVHTNEVKLRSMLRRDIKELYEAALSSKHEAAPLQTYFSDTLRIRVPSADAPMYELIREAHASVTQRGASISNSEQYFAAMKQEVARRLRESPVFWARLWPAGLALGKLLLM